MSGMSCGESEYSSGMFLRTTQNGDFVLLPCVCCAVGALAPCRRGRARLAQWRLSVLSLPLVLCVHERFC